MRKIFTKTLIFILLIQTSAECSPQMAKKDVREIKASAIIAQLNAGKHIYLTHCIVWGDLDFTTLRNRNRISNNLTQVFVDQSITFDDCIFINQVKAYDATAGVCVEFVHNLSFIGCDFRGEVDFTESIVGGHLFFTGSVFRGIAHFQGAHFRHKKTYFNETQFEDEALFQNAVFAGDANFMHAVFHSSALFQKVVAGGLMFFGNVRFNGYADFTYARAAESIFRYAQFNGRSDFSDSNLTPDMQIDN